MSALTEPDLVGRDVLAAFLEHALAGRARLAVGLALGLLDRGVPAHVVVRDLLVPAQHEVGRRWERDELSVADEHLATGCAEAALHALGMADGGHAGRGQVVLACAEGDWHGIAAHMFAVQLESAGFGVRFLGASTPAAHVTRLLRQQPADALVVSCSMPTYFAGVASLVDAAHAVGVPVLAGGHGLRGGDGEHARRLGADAWAPDVEHALAALDRWSVRPPPLACRSIPLPPDALELQRQAHGLAVTLAGRDLSPEQLTVEDRALVLQFLAAAQLVGADDVFHDFLGWLGPLLATRGRSPLALAAELESLASCLPHLAPAVRSLLRAGAAGLAA